jgi:hypothetical protein
VGAAAVGALAAGGTGLLSAGSSALAATPRSSEAQEPIIDGSDVIAHVVDARRGKISILVGEREITYTNRRLAQELMRAAR